MLTARFVPGTRIPTYVACGFFKAHYGKYMIVLVLTASLYVAITFGLFHTVGAVIGEKAKFWLPIIAIVCLAIYICVRWFNHVNRHEGPMTPMSKEFDHADTCLLKSSFARHYVSLFSDKTNLL